LLVISTESDIHHPDFCIYRKLELQCSVFMGYAVMKSFLFIVS